MKSFLYVGASLMIGASIYGIIDYQKTSHEKEFKTLYADPEPEIVVVQEPATGAVVTAPVEKKDVGQPKNEQEAAVVTSGKTVTGNHEVADNSEITSSPKIASKSKKELKLEKELDYRLFSRAAPPRRTIVVKEEREEAIVDTLAHE